MKISKNQSIKRELTGKCATCQKLQKVIARQTKQSDGTKAKQRYFDEKVLAARWGLSVKHIQKMRYAGNGPKVTYFGSAVRYRLRDIVEYERGHSFASRTARDSHSSLDDLG